MQRHLPTRLCLSAGGHLGAGTCVIWDQGKWEVLGSSALEATDGWGFVGKYPNLRAPQWAQATLWRCLEWLSAVAISGV